MKLSVLALRNIGRNKRRSILSISAIAITALIIVMLMGILGFMKWDVRNTIVTYISGHVQVRNPVLEEEEDLNPLRYAVDRVSERVAEIEAVPGIERVSIRMMMGTSVYREGRNITAAGLAVDFEREDAFQNLTENLIAGRLPSNDGKGALFPVGMAEDLGLALGDKVTMLFLTKRGGSNAVTFTVEGIADFGESPFNASFFFAPLSLMQRILRTGDEATEILVRGAEDADPVALAEDVRAAMGDDDMLVRPWMAVSEFWGIVKVGEISYAIMALVFFLLGSTVIINTVIMTIYERLKEIGTMGALGLHSGEIVRLFFYEATYLGVIGSAIGTFLGYLVSLPLQKNGIPLYDDFMSEMFTEMSGRMFLRIDVGTILYVFFFAAIVASVTSWFPARRAAGIEPVEALREE